MSENKSVEEKKDAQNDPLSRFKEVVIKVVNSEMDEAQLLLKLRMLTSKYEAGQRHRADEALKEVSFESL